MHIKAKFINEFADLDKSNSIDQCAINRLKKEFFNLFKIDIEYYISYMGTTLDVLENLLANNDIFGINKLLTSIENDDFLYNSIKETLNVIYSDLIKMN